MLYYPLLTSPSFCNSLVVNENIIGNAWLGYYTEDDGESWQWVEGCSSVYEHWGAGGEACGKARADTPCCLEGHPFTLDPEPTHPHPRRARWRD